MRQLLIWILAAGALMCSPNEPEEQTVPDESNDSECRCARIEGDGSGLLIELDCFCDWFNCPSESDLLLSAQQSYLSIGECDGIYSYGPAEPDLGGSVYSYRDGELIGAQVFQDVAIYCGHHQVRAGVDSCPIPQSENDSEWDGACQSQDGSAGGETALLCPVTR